jgi:hypothetical protein
MKAVLIGHDDLGYQVWQDPQTKRIVGACDDEATATQWLSRASCFSFSDYVKEFGFTPVDPS